MNVYYRTLLDTTTGSTYVNAIIAYANSQGWTIPSSGTISAMVTLVNSLVSSGIWNKLDIFYMFGYNDTSLSNFSRINWINPGTFNITFNSGGCTYFNNGFNNTYDGSYTGNKLNTNFITSTNGTNYSLNDCSIGVYGFVTFNIFVQSGRLFSDGSAYSEVQSVVGPKTVTYSYFYALQNTRIAFTPQTGLNVFVRNSSTNTDIYVNGTLNTSNTSTSTSLSTNAMNLLLSTNASAGGGVADDFTYISTYFMGSSLNSTENTSLNTYISTFRTTIGL